MNSSKSLIVALAFIAIAAIGTSAISTTYADINNPGRVSIDDSKVVSPIARPPTKVTTNNEIIR